MAVRYRFPQARADDLAVLGSTDTACRGCSVLVPLRSRQERVTFPLVSGIPACLASTELPHRESRLAACVSWRLIVNSMAAYSDGE